MKHPHFLHVREHLERVRDGYSYIPDPESVYLGRVEKDHFWELVGLRLQGCPVVVLAALRFEREEGYWVGAVIINTTVTFATFVLVFGWLVAMTWPDVPWGVVMGITVTANAAIPIVFYPLSKTVWLALEMSWHPLELEELEQAAARAAMEEYQSLG